MFGGKFNIEQVLGAFGRYRTVFCLGLALILFCGLAILETLRPLAPHLLFLGSILVLSPLVSLVSGTRQVLRDPVTGLPLRLELVAGIAKGLRPSALTPAIKAAIVVELDNVRQIEERHGRGAVEHVLRLATDRLCMTLRDTDICARLDGPCFGIGLTTGQRLDLERAIQLTGRIQQSLAEPYLFNGINIFLTASIGFCLREKLSNPTAETLLQAATSALIEAQRSAPAAVRSYSTAMHQRINDRRALGQAVSEALENGQICAFFQPQIDAKTSAITGFETLARWEHPERGLISPAEFLPALSEAGMMDRLGQLMVRDGLRALRRWDDKCLGIPRIGVNLSNEELRDPHLVDKISRQLDDAGLDATRLSIEVLETVVADGADDIIIRNLGALSAMGCGLDLDDFGTGHASITSIRRFSVQRIKIDRSFISRIDDDEEQSNMVAAILTMAERLGLDTLAEGVETQGEQEMLLRLGCRHLQGFGIARPMPDSEVDLWITNHQTPLSGATPFRRMAS